MDNELVVYENPLTIEEFEEIAERHGVRLIAIWDDGDGELTIVHEKGAQYSYEEYWEGSVPFVQLIVRVMDYDEDGEYERFTYTLFVEKEGET